MYKEVTTKFDHAFFREVFTKTTEKLGHHYNESTGKETRYLFLKTGVNPNNYQLDDVIGTAEINPFTEQSIVQPYTDVVLAEHPAIKPYAFDTYELGKLCFKEEYRKMGYLTRFFAVICEHQQKVNAKQYLAQMILPLHDTMKRSLQLKMHVLGEPDDFLVPAIPVLVRFDEVMENKQVQRLLRRKVKLTM